MILHTGLQQLPTHQNATMWDAFIITQLTLYHPDDTLCNSMENIERQWIALACTGMHETALACMGLHGAAWTCMGLHGHA